jgi:hypothetical protein
MKRLLALLLLLAAPVSAQLTSADFTYQGAFKLPDTMGPGGSYINNYGQRGMTFDPSGDGGAGSLWMTGHDWVMEAYEISIPTPQDTSFGSLPTASVLTSPFDTRGGVSACGSDSPQGAGIEIHGSYIWFGCGYRYTVSGANRTDIMWRRDASNLANPSGPYRAGPANDTFHSNRQGAYLFEIPSAWVTANLDGNKSLGTGQCRNSHGGAAGPTFFAFDPSSPSTAEAVFYYPPEGQTNNPNANTQCNASHVCWWPDYTPCDIFNGAAWVETAGDDALLLGGINCHGSVAYEPGGWVCGGCYGEIIFYSPADMAASLAGSVDPWDVLPYETWRPSDHYGTTHEIGGMAFDSSGGKLYVTEKYGGPDGKAAVHVYSVGTPSGSSYVLTVAKAGTGVGTVTSSPSGINCGSDCSELYDEDTAVTLTATPQGSSTFSGWSGDADCSDGSVTMTAARSCTATFAVTTEESVACAPLAEPVGTVVDVGPSDDFVGAIESAASGTTVRLAVGVYDLSGGDSADRINMSTPGVTVRGATDNAQDVVIDADYGTEECFDITASNVTLANFTIKECGEHGIHQQGPFDNEISGLHVFNLIVQDNSAQQFKGSFNGAGWTDSGIIECSEFLFTDTGRANVEGGSICYTGAIDVHGGDDWIVRYNKIQGFWCATGIPDPAVHFWNGSRDTLVHNNLFIDNARDIMFGGPEASSPARTYSPDPYPGDELQHIDGEIRNNFIAWSDSGMQSSATGKDSGVQCESCKSVDIYSNTIAGTFAPTVSGIEVRYAVSEADAINNLTTATLVERNSGTFTTDTDNVESVSTVYFTDVASGDLHLTASATNALDEGTTGYVTDDYDKHARANPPDIGADEYGSTAPAFTLTISKSGPGSGTVSTNGQGIDCGSDCTEDYDQDDVIVLDVVPDSDSFFRFFDGDADCKDGRVTMTGAVNCSVVFAHKNLPGAQIDGGVEVD